MRVTFSPGSSEGIYALLGQIFDPQGCPRSTRFVLDPGPAPLFDPVVLITIAHINAILEKEGVSLLAGREGLSLTPARISLRQIHMWLESGAWKLRGQDQCKYLPLEQIAVTRGKEWFENVLELWLSHLFHIPSDRLRPTMEALGEVVLNVHDHAGVTSFQVLAYIEYLQADAYWLHMLFSDTGIGIPAAMRRVHSEWDHDDELLYKALQPGITSDAQGYHAGMGLSRLLTTFVLARGGGIEVLSGSGAISCQMESHVLIRRLRLLPVSFPGTLFHIKTPLHPLIRYMYANEPPLLTGVEGFL